LDLFIEDLGELKMSAAAGKDDTKQSGLARFMPIVGWLPNYDRSWLRGDIIAGLSVWGLMVPTSLGYATISGVPVQYGLYAAALGLIFFALFTTSRQVTQGPSSSTAAVLGAAVLAASIVVVAGILYIILYLLKMGWISDFLSSAVLTGFTFGVAINVAVGQLFKITGTESSGSNTWQKAWAWITSLDEANMATVVVGVLTLLLVFGVKLFAPKIPGALIAVILGIAASLLLDLGDMGVALVGDVPRGLPSFVFPDVGLIMDNLVLVLGAAVGLLLIGFSVTTAAVRENANKYNFKVDINQEMLAQGMSNVASGLFQGIFDNASLSKTPINEDAGANSQVSNLVQAALFILTLLFLAPLFSYLPEAILGAVIIEAVVMGMMDVAEMKRLWHVKPFEFVVAMAALLGVMTFGILQGVVIGVILSIVWLVAVSALPYIPELGRKPGSDAFYDLKEHPDGETYPGLSIVRFDGGIFFVNADALGDRLRNIRVNAKDELTGIIISMEGVDFIDTEGSDALKKIFKTGSAHSVDLHMARVKPQVLDVLQRDGVIDAIGADHIHDNIADAVELHLSKHPLEQGE
jgi:SulP family sulfate permease